MTVNVSHHFDHRISRMAFKWLNQHEPTRSILGISCNEVQAKIRKGMNNTWVCLRIGYDEKIVHPFPCTMGIQRYRYYLIVYSGTYPKESNYETLLINHGLSQGPCRCPARQLAAFCLLMPTDAQSISVYEGSHLVLISQKPVVNEFNSCRLICATAPCRWNTAMASS